MAAPRAEIDGDADALVAVVFDGFHFAAPHRDRLADALRDVGFAGAGAELLRMVERGLREFAQACGGIAEIVAGHRRGGGNAKAIIIPVEDHDDAPGRPSKTQKKREMEALQETGAELVRLGRDQLARIDLPEDLRDAVRDAQRFTQHEAHRRQLQYIGRLMRDLDPAPIRAALDAIKGVSAAATARLHNLERLRTRLLEDENVLGEIARNHPGADLQHLRQLRRNALKEREQIRPPRAYRELFRVLKELEEPHDADEPGTADD